MHFKLWMDSEKGMSLSRTEFQSNYDSILIATVRGRVAPSFMKLGTFSWSPAVRAMTLLVLKFAAKDGDQLPRNFADCASISGMTGSLAASLDYALDKAPSWLVDMFGSDSRGVPIARRLFCRLNPGRKRSGPVVVCVNANLIRPKDVCIFLDEKVVASRGSILSNMIEKLETCESAYKSNTREFATGVSFEIADGIPSLEGHSR